MKIKFLSKIRAIVEFEPSLRTINYIDTDDMGAASRYTFSMPYQVFDLRFEKSTFEEYYVLENLYFYFRKEPLAKFGDVLLIPPLTNLRDDCHVCLGSCGVSGKTLSTIVERTLSRFWESKFSQELSWCYKNSPVFWWWWHYRSRFNPEYWKSLPLKKTGCLRLRDRDLRRKVKINQLSELQWS